MNPNFNFYFKDYFLENVPVDTLFWSLPVLGICLLFFCTSLFNWVLGTTFSDCCYFLPLWHCVHCLSSQSLWIQVHQVLKDFPWFCTISHHISHLISALSGYQLAGSLIWLTICWFSLCSICITKC